MEPRSLLGVLLLLAVVPVPHTLEAQAGMVVGVVHALGTDSTGVSDVVVTLTPSDRVALTDSLGAFRFAALPAGDYLLSAKRLGYDAVFKTFRIATGRKTSLQIVMIPIAERMATITVSGRRMTYPVRLTEPYQRLERGTGHFVTREQIDSLFPLDVASLLQRVPGLRVRSGSIEFARCTELGANNQKVQVWVNGQRWTNYSFGGGLNVSASDAIRDIPPSSIQLMEIYSGSSSIPAEFLDDACAVILIWRN